MVVTGLLFLGAVAILVAFIIVTDGTYLGKRGVRFIYQRVARFWSYPTSPRFRASDELTLLPPMETALSGMSSPRVLDVATGTGRIPLLLASQAWFNGTVTGIDISANMLARAQANVRSLGVEDHVELIEMDATSLPWPDATFDLVTCVEALLNFPRPRRALAEMVRVLKPGGWLLITKVSDRHARLVPGKALTKKGFIKCLSKMGIEEVTFAPFGLEGSLRTREEIVLARKDSELQGPGQARTRRESSWA